MKKSFLFRGSARKSKSSSTRTAEIILLSVLIVALLSAFAACGWGANVKLSDMSENECLDFIVASGVVIPEELKSSDIGDFVKELISRAEEYPHIPMAVSYTVTFDFTEKVRKAVNDYYGIQSDYYGSNG